MRASLCRPVIGILRSHAVKTANKDGLNVLGRGRWRNVAGAGPPHHVIFKMARGQTACKAAQSGFESNLSLFVLVMYAMVMVVVYRSSCLKLY